MDKVTPRTLSGFMELLRNGRCCLIKMVESLRGPCAVRLHGAGHTGHRGVRILLAKRR